MGEINELEYIDLHQTLKIAVTAITEIYQPQGYNIGLNNGSTAGAGIPEHIHFHLVPRWNGDLNFFPLIAETIFFPLNIFLSSLLNTRILVECKVLFKLILFYNYSYVS